MANLQAPYGFRHIGYQGGLVPNFANAPGTVSMADTNALFFGDPLVRLASGYLTKATPGVTQIAGIFVGCEYLSLALGYKKRSQYYPGSDAAADVAIQMISNSNAEFQVQTGNGGPVGMAAVGENINFGLSPGNTRTFVSGAFADFSTLGLATTLPFRILRFVNDPPGVNGADPTTPFNDIIVGFNFQDGKSLVGI